MDGYDKNGLTPFRAWCFKNWPYLISDDMTEIELLYAILGKFNENLNRIMPYYNALALTQYQKFLNLQKHRKSYIILIA